MQEGDISRLCRVNDVPLILISGGTFFCGRSSYLGRRPSVTVRRERDGLLGFVRCASVGRVRGGNLFRGTGGRLYHMGECRLGRLFLLGSMFTSCLCFILGLRSLRFLSCVLCSPRACERNSSYYCSRQSSPSSSST